MLMVPAAVMGGGGNMVDMFAFAFEFDEATAIGGGMLRFGGGMRIRFVVAVGVGGVAPFMGGGGLFICINIFVFVFVRSFYQSLLFIVVFYDETRFEFSSLKIYKILKK